MRPAQPRTVFQVFAKAPVPGYAKTRLIPALGPEGSARLQAALVRHALRLCSEAAARVSGSVELWCMPDCTHPVFRDCGTRFAVALHRQQGADLGERMRFALGAGLARAAGAVLLGTDAPTLDAAQLGRAARALTGGCDAVIAPAQDGGYVLIGLTRIDRELFEGVSWGTARVLHQTRERLRHLAYRWLELAPQYDIDRPEDWERLLADAPEWRQRLAAG